MLKFSLVRVRLNAGGYDSFGCYWGSGAPLYAFHSECGTVSDYIRATSRAAAKEKIRARYPEAKFYR